MIRPVSIRYQGMRIEGTVESPDAKPARFFGRSFDFGWSELEIITHEHHGSFWSEIRETKTVRS